MPLRIVVNFGLMGADPLRSRVRTPIGPFTEVVRVVRLVTVFSPER